MTFIGIDPRGLKELQDLLRKLPQAARDAVSDAVADYLLRVMRLYPPKNYVTRTRAYGRPFQTDKQRRWFFANLRSGALQIPYRRTQGLAQGWHKAGEGEAAFLYNERPGAEYVIGDDMQSRHEALVGWKTVGGTISEREAQITRRGEAAAQNAIRKLDK